MEKLINMFNKTLYMGFFSLFPVLRTNGWDEPFFTLEEGPLKNRVVRLELLKRTQLGILVVSPI